MIALNERCDKPAKEILREPHFDPLLFETKDPFYRIPLQKVKLKKIDNINITFILHMFNQDL